MILKPRRMSLLRHAKARDANEGVIVDALRKSGLSVYRLDQPLDLLVGFGGITRLAEVKMPRNKRGDPKPYTDPQTTFIDEWLGGYTLLVTVDDALKLAKEIKAYARAMQAFTLSFALENAKNKAATGSADTPPATLPTDHSIGGQIG